MKMEQSVPKRRHIKYRRQGATQKKEYNIYNKACKFEIESNLGFILKEYSYNRVYEHYILVRTVSVKTLKKFIDVY